MDDFRTLDDNTITRPVRGEIDLTTLDWDELDDAVVSAIKQKVGKAITRVIRETFEREPPQVYLAHQYSDVREDDPVLLHVSVPLGAREDEPPLFACSLETLVNDVIKLFVSHSKGVIVEPEGKLIVRQIATRLHELATKLQNACAKD